MRSLKLLAIMLLSLPALAKVITAQGIPGYTLQETVLVPVTGTAVTSLTTLIAGVDYKLRAVGTAQVFTPSLLWWNYQQADAEYAFDPTGLFGLQLEVNKCRFVVDIGLAVNDPGNTGFKTPEWGSYNSGHVYVTDFKGVGAPISLNYHNCNYSGSAGALTVQIFRPMGMGLPTIGQPGYTDVSPGLQNFPLLTGNSTSGRANALAVAGDGKRLYAGTYAGVWRSDDGGVTWRQMTQAQPPAGVNAVPGALFVPDVYDVAISPQNPDVVMVGAMDDLHAQGMNGIFRSEDGGNTWALVKQFTCSGGGAVTQIVFAPDDPSLAYAAGTCAIGLSRDGGKTWTEVNIPGLDTVYHIAVAPFEPPVYRDQAVKIVGGPTYGVRRIYAMGEGQLAYSTDGGQSWNLDGGLSAVAQVKGGDLPATANGGSSRVLMVEPVNNQHVLLAVPSLSNGPSYYDNPTCGSKVTIPDGMTCNTGDRQCGEGSIWLGDFTGFGSATGTPPAAVWTQLPSPPTYWGVTTPSGTSYLDVKPMGNSYLVFLSDRSHVHVSEGLPTARGWHRLDSIDASQTAPPHPPNPYCNDHIFVHPDPHAIAIAPNFSLTLRPLRFSFFPPYNQNSVAAPGASGDIWMADDGGVYHSTGAQPNWQRGNGLSTLATVNIAGLAAKGLAPALYFGTGDNGDFYSLDGGSSWNIQKNACGDCDAWFADPAQVQQVMGFMPYADGGGFYVFTNTGKYPDAGIVPSDATAFAHWYCPASCNASSSFYNRGYRPMVLTSAGAVAPPTGDYIVIGTRSDGTRVVFRKTNATPMQSTLDWENTSNAVQYGPTLPACGGTLDCLDVVQASGGHGAPVLYAGDPAGAPGDARQAHFYTLWKWTPGDAAWQQIVPSPQTTPPAQAAQLAYRYFADPFDPNTIYLLDDDGVKRSDDGGATWTLDVSLDNAVSENHAYSYLYSNDSSVLRDMVFVRGERKTRFAVGNAGVFYTLDGKNWNRLLSTSALPSHPVAAYFDNVSDNCDRALYVGMAGRGILRIDPIPAPGPLGLGSQVCQPGIYKNAKP